MARCDVCGNESDRCLEIQRGDQTGVFDCFECAISSSFVPECAHCRCRILGHGVDRGSKTFCCAGCAGAASAAPASRRSVA